jgi:glycosyltransferase involved in cell wall biosynthesis
LIQQADGNECTKNYKKKHQELSGNKPHVSIGMPVFNGEKYLKEALNSILAQTHRDFELIISDNASTDRTQQICREYATKDSRIRYYRNEINIGAPKNFNRVFELSSSEYFKWASSDDMHAPTYLQKCVSILETDPSIILCHSKTGRIDKHGRLVGNYDRKGMASINSWKPHERFGVFLSKRNPCWALFGVTRASILKDTPLQESYIGADRNLAAEIALRGRMYEIPEYLFFGRDHPQSYTRKFYSGKFIASANNYRQQLVWWTQENWFAFPHLKNCFEYFRSVNRVRLKWSERLLCYNQIFTWFMKEGWIFMANDIENLLLRHSRLARKLIPFINLNIGRARRVISTIKRHVDY